MKNKPCEENRESSDPAESRESTTEDELLAKRKVVNELLVPPGVDPDDDLLRAGC